MDSFNSSSSGGGTVVVVVVVVVAAGVLSLNLMPIQHYHEQIVRLADPLLQHSTWIDSFQYTFQKQSVVGATLARLLLRRTMLQSI